MEDDDVVIDPISTSGPRECAETGLATWFDGYLVGHEDPKNANDIAEEAALVSTAGKCADRCNTTPACESWTYYTTELEVNCRLFKDRPERVKDDSVAIFAKSGGSAAATAKSGYRRISPWLKGNTAFFTTPLGQDVRVSSFVKCMGLCGSTKGCLYWSAILPSFPKGNEESVSYTCRLYDYTARRAALADPLATSGTAIVPGYHHVGAKVEEGEFVVKNGEALDIDGCSTECRTLHSCRAFNFEFNTATNPCKLLTLPLVENSDTRKLQYTKAKGAASGARVQSELKLVMLADGFSGADDPSKE